jgi:Zn-dependent protease with chaperone function
VDFFAQQAKVRSSGHKLVVLFVIAVIAVVVAIDVVVVLAFQFTGHGDTPAPPVDPAMLVGISIAALVVIGLASLYRTASLRSGGGAVAQGLGATLVPADTSDPVLRRLRNVIEEVAIASGVPVPEIYVLQQEAGINAFAAGYTPSDAAVCVTQGCLDKLNRDELQGVIAHEFSHVLNGDMRLNIRLMGLLFGILVIGIVGRFMMYSGGTVRSRRGNSTAYIAMIGIALLVVGYLGFFFGRLIQAAVARSRESLADASAVQFTRQNTGIAGALKKIAALAEGSQLQASNKQEVAHMLFGEAGRFSSLFATHPPLPERIRALGAEYDEAEIERLALAWQQPQRATHADDPAASLSGFAPAFTGAAATVAPAHRPLPAAHAEMNLDAASVSAQVGQPGADDVGAAGNLHRHIPPPLAAAVRQPQQALAVLLALAMGDDASLRDAQLLRIDNGLGSACAEDAEKALALLAGLHPMLRLPLAALAFPAIRRRPRPQLDALVKTLAALVRADDRVDLHEYCLVTLLRLQIKDALDPAGGFVPGGRRLRQSRDAYAALCAIVAQHGHDDAASARRAWLLAMQQALPSSADADGYAPPADWQAALDNAFAELDRLAPADKELVIRGLSIAIAEDDKVTVAEAELLRVVCAALHCPLPPILGQLAPSA